MTREQLKAKGYAEILPGKWVKGNPDISFGKTITLNPPEPAPKRIRQSSKPLLNKLETEYQQLLLLKSPYSNPTVYPQALRFRLANGAWYKPDLAQWIYGGLSCYEVKGPKGMKGQAKGLMTLKIAAAQYPEIDWFLVWKENGEWKSQQVLP